MHAACMSTGIGASAPASSFVCNERPRVLWEAALWGRRSPPGVVFSHSRAARACQPGGHASSVIVAQLFCFQCFCLGMNSYYFPGYLPLKYTSKPDYNSCARAANLDTRSPQQRTEFKVVTQCSDIVPPSSLINWAITWITAHESLLASDASICS